MKKLSEAQLKSMMDMGGEDYAMQECWDIQQAAQALGFIAALCQNECDEPDDVQSLANIMRSLMEFINGEIKEMVDAAKQGESYEKHFAEAKSDPDSDFLVVDKEGQHLRVKRGGTPDHNLMGAAWAALHGGYRGNKYEGSGKEEAISKLKRLYASEKMDLPSEKSLNLSYVKSLGIALPENELIERLAVKFVAKDQIKGYSVLWGDPAKVDLEREYFTKDTNFWDNQPKHLTWDHAQDVEWKADPRIGDILETGEDDWGKWYVSRLKRSEAYRRYLDSMIEQKRVGSSSDSAPQYVERVKTGKATWLKTWPLFAVSLTDTPCEPRMIGSLEFLKSLGITLPDVPPQTGWEANFQAIHDYTQLKYLGD